MTIEDGVLLEDAFYVRQHVAKCVSTVMLTSARISIHIDHMVNVDLLRHATILRTPDYPAPAQGEPLGYWSLTVQHPARCVCPR